jgi:hypothetical protein
MAHKIVESTAAKEKRFRSQIRGAITRKAKRYEERGKDGMYGLLFFKLKEEAGLKHKPLDQYELPELERLVEELPSSRWSNV